MVDVKQKKQVSKALEHRKRLFSFSNVLACNGGSWRDELKVDVQGRGDNEH
jgi:hypothetical protein